MNHPQDIISKESLQIIRRNSLESDVQRKINVAVLDLIYKKKWLQITVPKKSGGLEWEFPKIVRTFEALAWADANVGWIVNLGAGANMFSGYFNKDVSRKIFDSPKTCCAGSGAASGKAINTKDGYLVSGYWKYASGSNHATHFTANCLLYNEQGEAILKNDDHAFRSFIIEKKDVTIYDTWKTLGLKATSSNDFEVNDLFIPENHTFSLLAPSSFASGSLYKFPFSSLAILNMAVMSTGIALHFLELFKEIAAVKKPLYLEKTLLENAILKDTIQKASSEFLISREEMYDHLENAWENLKSTGIPDNKLMENVNAAAHKVAQKSYEAVTKLYPFCGMSIVYDGSELNKIFRDFMTANQHYLLSPLNYKS